ELIQQQVFFGRLVVFRSFNVRRMDVFCAAFFKHIDGIFNEFVQPGVETKVETGDTDADSFQSIWVQERRVVRRIYFRIPQRTQKNCGVGDGTTHWTGRVLAVGNRNDSGTADQTHRGLDSDNSTNARWAHDGTVRLRADGQSGE